MYKREKTMTETEIKSIIDEETYKKVKKTFNWDSVKEQVNNYYTDRTECLANAA